MFQKFHLGHDQLTSPIEPFRSYYYSMDALNLDIHYDNQRYHLEPKTGYSLLFTIVMMLDHVISSYSRDNQIPNSSGISKFCSLKSAVICISKS